ncbi:hypothetical protein Javan173_0044 [Streptococcus phage Javan173]|uniref:hypothetical protein n=1 Tax=Streptococcus entericus TaxID=155680 RepID=UPI00036F2625|nr:hypothetical protein [Streptococcus entericus]QBX15173.1 hypothetical protein Javan173_0044 [Streptococcus phage Javan173]
MKKNEVNTPSRLTRLEKSVRAVESNQKEVDYRLKLLEKTTRRQETLIGGLLVICGLSILVSMLAVHLAFQSVDRVHELDRQAVRLKDSYLANSQRLERMFRTAIAGKEYYGD